MPLTDTSFYRSRDDIVSEMLSQLAAAIPDAYTGEDGNWSITFEINAGQMENLFLAHQILLEDMFVTTASYSALLRHGEQYQITPKVGTNALGSLQFEGTGGDYVPIGTEAAYDPGGGLDPVFFTTTVDGTIPNPGVPDAPVASVVASAGNLNGLYEYGVTFVTATGETLMSAISGAINPVSQQANVVVPVGGQGAVNRVIYRRKDGVGNFRRLVILGDNTTTTYADNLTDAAIAGNPLAPTVDQAHRITLAAQAVAPGSDGNVVAGVVTLLSNAPSTITGVTNDAPFAGGSEPEETEDFRNRLLQWIRAPGTGSPSDLQAIAENVLGVESATVFPNTNLAGVPTPGTVIVRISGPNGSVPPQQVLDDVQFALQQYDIANITILVATFTAVPTNVTVDITTSGTYTLADITPSVVAAIQNYINTLDVGETLRVAGITDAVFGLPGVADVVVTVPSANQTTAADSKRTAGTITVT